MLKKSIVTLVLITGVMCNESYIVNTPVVMNNVNNAMVEPITGRMVVKLLPPPLTIEPVAEVEDIEPIELQVEEVQAEEVEAEIVETYEEEETYEEISNIRYYKFEVSYYCSCYYCTQNTTDVGRTASGSYAVEGRTIATPGDIPFGSEVFIEGVGNFIVEDRGGFIEYSYDEYGNEVMRVDVYIDSHERALEMGRHYEYGYILLNEEGY